MIVVVTTGRMLAQIVMLTQENVFSVQIVRIAWIWVTETKSVKMEEVEGALKVSQEIYNCFIIAASGLRSCPYYIEF